MDLGFEDAGPLRIDQHWAAEGAERVLGVIWHAVDEVAAVQRAPRCVELRGPTWFTHTQNSNIQVHTYGNASRMALCNDIVMITRPVCMK